MHKVVDRYGQVFSNVRTWLGPNRDVPFSRLNLTFFKVRSFQMSCNLLLIASRGVWYQLVSSFIDMATTLRSVLRRENTVTPPPRNAILIVHAVYLSFTHSN